MHEIDHMQSQIDKIIASLESITELFECITYWKEFALEERLNAINKTVAEHIKVCGGK